MLGLKIVKHLYIGHLFVKLLGLCKNHKIITPPQLRSPLPFDWRGAGYHCCLTWLPTPRRENLPSLFQLPTPRREELRSLLRLPTPRRGGVLARGAGCKITATKQFIPTLGTKHSHVGNCHHQSLMLAIMSKKLFAHFPLYKKQVKNTGIVSDIRNLYFEC